MHCINTFFYTFVQKFNFTILTISLHEVFVTSTHTHTHIWHSKTTRQDKTSHKIKRVYNEWRIFLIKYHLIKALTTWIYVNLFFLCLVCMYEEWRDDYHWNLVFPPYHRMTLLNFNCYQHFCSFTLVCT